MAVNITIQNAAGTKIYYPKTVSDLVYDNSSGLTVRLQIDDTNINLSKVNLGLGRNKNVLYSTSTVESYWSYGSYIDVDIKNGNEPIGDLLKYSGFSAKLTITNGLDLFDNGWTGSYSVLYLNNNNTWTPINATAKHLNETFDINSIPSISDFRNNKIRISSSSKVESQYEPTVHINFAIYDKDNPIDSLAETFNEEIASVEDEVKYVTGNSIELTKNSTISGSNGYYDIGGSYISNKTDLLIIEVLNSEQLISEGFNSIRVITNNGGWKNVLLEGENADISKPIIVNLKSEYYVSGAGIRLYKTGGIATLSAAQLKLTQGSLEDYNILFKKYIDTEVGAISESVESINELNLPNTELYSYEGNKSGSFPQVNWLDSSWVEIGVQLGIDVTMPEGATWFRVYSLNTGSTHDISGTIRTPTAGVYHFYYTVQEGDYVSADNFTGIRVLFLGTTEAKHYKTVFYKTGLINDIDNRLNSIDSNIADINSALDKSPFLNVLFLGDSYTQMGNWVRGLLKLLPIKSYLNLGTSGGNLKDDSNDYETYPRVDRIYQTMVNVNGSDKNVNVFSSEVEWFKRMVNGDIRGPWYKLTFTNATGGGSITLSYNYLGDYTVNIGASMTASDIASYVALLLIPYHSIVHPTGTDYVEIQSMDYQYTQYPTITTSVTEVTRTNLRNAESVPFNGEDLHLVIIAGGKNDSSDTDAKIATYEQLVITKVSNTWINHYGTVKIGTACRHTDDSEVDHTCFVGALRYIMEEIHKLYPNAVFVLVGTSGFNYGSAGMSGDLLKDTQEALAASYLSLPYVSWVKDGNVNRLFNYPSGSGTQEDPYKTTDSTEDTADLMHPNDRGGLKLATAVAAKVNELIPYIKLVNE